MDPTPSSPHGLYVLTRPGAAPGERAAIVVVHGVLDSARSFGRLIRSLGPERTVVSYDRRGYQRSVALSPEGDALEAHIDDLVALTRREATPPGGPRPVLFGHSYGGVVVLAALARDHDLAAAAVVYEPPLSWLPWWSGPGSLQPGAGEAPDAFAERFISAMIGSARFARLGPDVRCALRADGVAAHRELAELGTRAPLDLAKVRTPVTVVRGSLAPARHRRGAAVLAEELPDARLVVVPEAPHGAHLSHPREVAAILERVAAASEHGTCR